VRPERRRQALRAAALQPERRRRALKVVALRPDLERQALRAAPPGLEAAGLEPRIRE
jgi:hypothetical protein